MRRAGSSGNDAGRRAKSRSKEKGDYAIQTVTNALRVLDTLGEQGEVGVADLSRRLSLHKNNIFRLLATLEQEGYVKQNHLTERYRLGLRSLELGQAFARDHSLALRGRVVVKALQAETGESAHLAVSSAFGAVAIEGAATERALVASMRVGSHHPLHCTALGKVLLASAESAVLQEHHEAAVARGGLLQKTPATILDPDKFLEELRSVASVGYALDREEFETGLCCAAAPIYGSEGAVVAALSLSIPRARCSDDALLDRVVPAVTESARRLSRELGAVD